tara:strand:+ start:2515 stop:2907 length:393 start_codon:yes stop_codon:yes gene_type:complete
MTNNTQVDRLNAMYKHYGLLPEDMFKEARQGWTIFRRQGIDKIQAKANIDIKYKTIVCEKDFVVIKAKGKLDENKIETFGEADRNSNCRQTYPVAMAEKRAMARVVLKLTGFYALGHFSEDEGDFKRSTL